MKKTNHRMAGRVCLVTGATSGIGAVTALELARMGATVIAGGRDEQKAAKTVTRIRRQTGNKAVEYLLADFSSLDQVRSLANSFREQHQQLHVLVNNAGAIFLRRKLSHDGIEMTFAVNHLAPFLLTNLLLETMVASAPARIVNVASDSHETARMNFDDLQGQSSYNFMRAYGQSKLANVMFTYALDSQLEGSGVTANALHPGLVATNMGSNNGLPVGLFRPLMRLLALSAEEGAQTSIYLASADQVADMSGKYFFKKRAVPSSPASYDQGAQQRLWQISAEMVGI